MRKKSRMPEEVMERLKAHLLQGHRPGDRVSSIRELAGRWKVSHWSLRTAQALLEKEGWLEIRHGSGVYAGRRVAAPAVGVFTAFDVFQPRTSLFHRLVLRASRQELESQGMAAEVYVGRCAAGEELPPEECGRFVFDAEAGRLDGVVLVSVSSHASWEEWIASLKIPAVGDRTPYDLDVPTDEMVREAVRRLRRAGCSRLALLGWGLRKVESAFCDEIARNGLTPNPKWIRGDLHPMLSGAGWEEFREIWTAFREKPDGLVAADDVLFDEAARAILEIGIDVPRAMKVAVLANKRQPWLWPFPAVRIQVDPVLFGRRLARLLSLRMQGARLEPCCEKIPYEVAEGEPVCVALLGEQAGGRSVRGSRGEEQE